MDALGNDLLLYQPQPSAQVRPTPPSFPHLTGTGSYSVPTVLLAHAHCNESLV